MKSRGIAFNRHITCRHYSRVIWLVLVLIASELTVFSQVPESLVVISPQRCDGLALDAIFSQQHLSESGVGICDRARAMPQQRAFEFLLKWVLPDDQHSSFRVTTDFASTTHQDPDQVNSLGTLALASPDYLRILRRGKDIHFLAGVSSEQREYLVGSTRVSKAPIKLRGVRLMLHTGGSGRTSQMLVKSIAVKAEGVTGLTVVPVSPPSKSLPNQLFDSIRDLLR